MALSLHVKNDLIWFVLIRLILVHILSGDPFQEMKQAQSNQRPSN